MSTKRKASAKLAAPIVKSSAKPSSRTTIDESRTAVSAPDEIQAASADAIEISSDPDSSEYEEDDTNDADNAKAVVKHETGRTNGEPGDAADDDSSEAEATSPSFGELLRGSEMIDVPALLQQNSSNSVQQPRSSAIAPPSHASLTTVLTQALRTDDADLLESCLHTNDATTIQNTVERIDSALAGTLLLKLASRLYRRPGRAGKLMIWVQWTLIAHGGALATQPKVVQGLSGLQKVLAERAKGLSSLLALKGKLDLLEGQMDLRRRMQRDSGAAHKDEEEDDDVIWVEGEDKATSENLTNGIGSRAGLDDDDDEPILNGLAGDSDEEEDSDVDDDDSVVGEELVDEDDVDHDDVDDSMGEDEDSDAEAGPPAKKRK